MLALHVYETRGYGHDIASDYCVVAVPIERTAENPATSTMISVAKVPDYRLGKLTEKIDTRTPSASSSR